MDNSFIIFESKLFCLLMVCFLYFFKRRNFPRQGKDCCRSYIFIIAAVLLSLAEIILRNSVIMAACGCCYALAGLFLCRFAFEIAGIRRFKKTASIIACAAFGGIAFVSLKYTANVVMYLQVLGEVILFVVEQHNKIKIDNLTKLYNRYGMDAELKEQLRQYEKEQDDSFYIIACDLDNFKHINDTWGHPEGDRALILIAGALSKVAKKFSSNVFRIGGDEFVIITDKSEKGLAEKITEAVKQELDTIDFRDDFDIKMSIGAALYDGKTAINELLNSADKKLYEAKKRKV